MYAKILKGAPMGNCNAIGGGTGCGKGSKASGSNYPLYHGTHSEAMSTAHDYIKTKGYEISDDDWFSHVSGTRKPSEGKTVSFDIPLHKDGKATNKYAHIQVYNRGNDIAKNYEVNVYVDGGKATTKKAYSDILNSK